MYQAVVHSTETLTTNNQYERHSKLQKKKKKKKKEVCIPLQKKEMCIGFKGMHIPFFWKLTVTFTLKKYLEKSFPLVTVYISF